MFRKLRNKFLLLNMAVTSLVMLTAFAAVYLTTYSNIKADNQKKLDSLTDSLIITEVSNMSPSVPELHGQRQEFSHSVSDRPAVGRMTSDSSPSFVVTVDKDGSIVGISSTLSVDTDEDFYAQAVDVAWNKDDSSAVTISGRQWIYNISPVRVVRIENGRQSKVEVSENRFQIAFFEVTDSLKTLQDLLITIILVSVGLLAVIFIISYVFANRAIKPISESWEKQRKFVADASHELKTPLSTIMANYDVLTANGDETIKNQREWLDYIKIGMDRMNRLVSNLLTLARSENATIQAQKLPFNIDKLICGIMQSMDASVQSKNLQVNKNIGFTGNINGYEEQVGQILTILYDNAVKYCDDDGRIDIEVKRVKKSCICSIRNTGQGIPPKDLPHIFDRFYRSDSARSGGDNSYGLGLPIAKSVAEQIGGEITAKSAEHEWAAFVLSFDLM